jgi:hypothetical protein
MASKDDKPPPADKGDAFVPPFSAQQAAEFMQRMWNPFGVPMPGFGMPGMAAGAPGVPPAAPFPNPAMMFAALDPVEVQRKIDDLHVVENWLAMSLSMMQMSIKTLELQKASLEALHPNGDASRSRSKR